MKWMKCLGLGVSALLTMLTVCGCATQNNYRECGEFFSCLARNNVAVTKAQPLDPNPFRATSGMAFEVEGMDGDKSTRIDIAVYKFNTDVEYMRNRLEEIRKAGCVYLVGVKLPTKINGSFILLGYERCKQKKQILKAFEEFE